MLHQSSFPISSSSMSSARQLHRICLQVWLYKKRILRTLQVSCGIMRSFGSHAGAQFPAAKGDNCCCVAFLTGTGLLSGVTQIMFLSHRCLSAVKPLFKLLCLGCLLHPTGNAFDASASLLCCGRSVACPQAGGNFSCGAADAIGGAFGTIQAPSPDAVFG